jgi:XTP/dITP diphosphohydrolase
MQLVLATENLHKIRELKSILKPLLKDVDIFSLKDFPPYEAPPETGKTFGENAILKAEAAAKHLGIYAIADDSGLVVPALGGRPGIYSRRYAGETCTEKESLDKLISELKNLREEERSGYFECAIAFASPEKLIKITAGFCEGSLIVEPRGRRGFGYDSIFIKYDYSKTLAEIEEEVKNRISHRRKALDKMILTVETELLATTL